jgi:hypothetical protein
MERPNTVAGLLDKRAEIAGLIKFHRQELQKLVCDLDHIDAAIRLFEPDADLSVTPKRYPTKHRAFKGEMMSSVLRALRESDGLLTSLDITKAQMAELVLVSQSCRAKASSNRCQRMDRIRGGDWRRSRIGPARTGPACSDTRAGAKLRRASVAGAGAGMIWMLFAAALSAAQSTTMKDYALGTGLADFKARPAPPSDWIDGKVLPVRVGCSDDGVQRRVGWLTSRGPGWVMCGFEQNYAPGEWVRNGLALSPDVPATVEFQFFESKLAIIGVYVDATHASVMEESLGSKFGAPAKTETRDFQVKSGAVFPQRVVTWKNGTDEIVLKAPDLTTQRMSVTYVDTVATAKAEAARQPASIL